MDAAAIPLDLVGLAFDVDDTLTRDGRVEREAFDALWRLHAAGVRLIAMTGRPVGFAEIWLRSWPIDAAVGENGAGWLWFEEGQVRCDSPLRPEAQQQAQALFATIREQVAEALPHVTLSDDHWARRFDLAFDIAEHASLSPEDVGRLQQIIEGAGAGFLRSSVHAHAALKGDHVVNKVTGFLGAHEAVFGESPDFQRWVFVGDSPNDAAAFAGFPLSVGVANVRAFLSQLPVPPTFITEADRGRGFAELADAMLQRRSSP